jgi:Nif-specific regulatory protein
VAAILIRTRGRTLRRSLSSGTELQIGADPTCDLLLTDPGVAPRHAVLRVDEDGSATVEDRGGGLDVNGSPARRHRLGAGDEVRVGDAVLRFEAAEPEPMVQVARDAGSFGTPTLRRIDAERVERYQRRLGLLVQLASSASAELGRGEVLDRMLDATVEAFEPERVVLALMEPDGQLRYEGVRHAGRQQDPWRDVQVSGTILTRVIQTGGAFITGNAMGSEEMARVHSVARKGIRSAMCAPFRQGGRARGALYVDHRGMTDCFDEEDLEFLVLISHLGAVALQNVTDYRASQAELERLRAGGETATELVGRSEGIERLRLALAKVARTELPVLILGERGTGKELVARAVHRLSGRGGFVAVNCAAVPETLTESSFFGHEKGAFTGADRQHRGFFEQADRGTLFLDEIADLRPPAQAAILRVLQEGEILRVGGSQTLKVDVRIVAATNRELGGGAGEFRGDLYDRLNVLQLRVPPLRERPDDIPLLAAHFAGQRVRRISARALSVLRDHGWPGNVRELRNVVERAIVMGDGETIWPEDLPGSMRERRPEHLLLPSLESVERDHIVRVLRHTGGNISRAAEILGIGRITIYKKLKRYGLEPADFKGQGPGG